MIIRFLLSALILLSSLNASSELNVYSHRHYYVDKKLFETFEEETGIKINLVELDSTELLKKVESEGKDTPADVIITVDAARLVYAQFKDLLQPIKSEKLELIVPAHLRQKDGYWFGVTKRARVIAYNKKRVDPKELSTYEDLTSPKWEGKVLVGKSSELYNLSLLSAFIANNGEENMTKWAAGIVKNMSRQPLEGDNAQIKGVYGKRGDVAIINTYYLGKLLESKLPQEVEVAKDIGIFFPNQGENQRGTHINISGMGVTKYTKNKENAIKFLEFMVSQKAQEVYPAAGFEYPVNENVKPSELLSSWGEFKEDKINLESLGYYNHKAVKIFNEVGWK